MALKKNHEAVEELVRFFRSKSFRFPPLLLLPREGLKDYILSYEQNTISQIITLSIILII